MKIIVPILLFVFLVSCIQAEDTNLKSDGNAKEKLKNLMEDSDLPLLGEAPELSNDVWLNTDGPLRLTELRGKVILLEMWTFG